MTEGERPRPPAWDANALSETFREKLIRLRTMEPRLHWIALVAMAGVVVAGLLIAGQDLPIGRVVLTGPVFHGASVSQPVVLACAALQVLAWGMVLTGGMHAHWPLRLLVLAIWSSAMFAIAFSPTVLPGRVTVLAVLVTAVGVLLLVMGVWLLAVGVWVVDHLQLGGAGRTHRHRLNLVTGLACLLATALIYGLAWVASRDPRGLDSAVALQLAYLAPYMILVLVVTGSDFTEWAEVVTGRLGTALARRRPALLAAGAGAVCAALVGIDVWLDRNVEDILLCVLQVATMVGVGLAVGRLLTPRPPIEIPPFTVVWTGVVALLPLYTLNFLVEAITLFLTPIAFFLLLTPLSGAVNRANGAPGLDTLGLSPAAFLGLQGAVAAGAAVLVLVARRAHRLREAAFFLAVLATGTLWEVAIHTAQEGGDGATFLESMAVAPALACLALLGWSAARREWAPRRMALVRLLLVLALGLQLVALLADGFDAAARYGEELSLAGGLLLVAAMFWDLATSGSAITNRHGPRAPRHARVLLYFGYTLLASSGVAFWTVIPAVNVIAGSPESWVRQGVSLLGPPLLVAYFTFGVLRLRHLAPE